MSSWSISIAELQQDRAQLQYQLSVEDNLRAQFPGFDLDEFRDWRKRLYAQLDDVDHRLSQLAVEKRAGRPPRTFGALIQQLRAMLPMRGRWMRHQGSVRRYHHDYR